jgi:hypothetical protein
MVATHLALMICVGSEHRIRFDCIDTRPYELCRACSSAIDAVVGIVSCIGMFAQAISIMKHPVQQVRSRISNSGHANPVSEHTQLLT